MEATFVIFLSSGTIKPAMLKPSFLSALKNFFAIGLDVKVLTCDQGSNNRSVMHSLFGVTVDGPYFIFKNVDKVYVVYDPPHLLKNIRNNLKFMVSWLGRKKFVGSML